MSSFAAHDMHDKEKAFTNVAVDDVAARLQNPLRGIPKDTLLSQVAEFAYTKGLADSLPILKKGALLAQDPHAFETIPELDEADREVIRREITNKWSQPRALYLTVIWCSLGAAVQGWYQTGSNGANLSFPIEFNLARVDGSPNNGRNEWIIGLINAAPYIAACLLGCWLTDPLNKYFGRRGTISISAIFCTVSVIGSACSQTWPQLLITRILLGLGMGAEGSTIPVFAAESAPASIRGGLVMSWQLWSTFGALLGFCANLALFQVGDIAWRLQLGSAFLPALPLIFGVYFCPRVPKMRLRNSELQAARDLYYAHCQLMEEFAMMQGLTYMTRLTELFTVPRIRRATVASFLMTLTQQMCGIIIIYFYSSTIFVESGYSVKAALLASLGFGFVNWIFGFPAIWTIDTLGRRNLLLAAFPNMAWSLLAAGFCLTMDNANPAKIPLTVLFIYIFTVFGSTGAFEFYAGLNVLSFFLVFFLIPETKQYTLEELNHIFARLTSEHVMYQATTYLPYWIKRYILFCKDVTLKPLYNFGGLQT
ncbi:Hexose transporter 2 [Hypsizygus marmoreus]|uniref:Hexose transporter 2 n=1 Tax=Hypsizygus marmoreus TaxID=39966 RepID=A0A369JQS4_HYPMA|nr:Hexose transporter 2 [Hypsizygus marmoreus]